MKRVVLLLSIVLIFALAGKNAEAANSFLVTTNADTGTGSLRAAIEAANSDVDMTGIADTISFGIAGSDFASRTIYLQSALPTLVRPIIIDGTSQASGGGFGKSNTKIKLVDSSQTNKFTGLNIEAINCEIYGMYLTGFASGIIVQEVNANAKIGSLTKGNLFNRIQQDACIRIQFSNNVVVNGNLIGTDSIGRNNNFLLPVSAAGVIINSCNDISIGTTGLFAGSPAGNVISNCDVGIELQQNKNIRILNNNIGSSRVGWLPIPNNHGILGDGLNTFIAVGGDTATESNTISGNYTNGIEGEFKYSYFKGNHIGVDGIGQNSQPNNVYGIYLKNGSMWNQIGDNTIEGANTIAYNFLGGIVLQNSTCTNNSIGINSMICNASQNPGGQGILLNRGNDSINVPDIIITTTSTMTGRTIPGSTVYFYTDDGGACIHCEGKTFLGSVQTDPAGVFTFSGQDLTDPRITATVTDPQGNSSEFTQCSRRSDSSTCISTVLLAPTTPQCSNNLINFYDQSVIFPGSEIVKRLWNFGDGDTSSLPAPVHSYLNGNSIYTVTLFDSTSAGCSSNETAIVFVSNSPQAAFSAPSFACSLTSIPFANSSSGGVGDSIVHYLWDFGDGLTDSTVNPTHAYADTGIYIVSLSVTNSHGCSASIFQGIAISQAPVVNFTYSIDSCTISLRDTSLTGGHVSYLWTFGDGATSTEVNPTHTYTKPGIYKVQEAIYDSACNITKVFFVPVTITANCVTGISEVKDSKDVRIIPNPAGSSFSIENNLQQPIQSIELYDVIGKVVYQIPSTNIQPNTSYRVQLPLLPNGVYTVRMKTSDSFVNVKVVESR